MTRTAGHRRAALTLPSVDALSTTTISCDAAGAGIVQGGQATLEIGPRVVADDHDRDVGHTAPSITARVAVAARGQSYRASTPGALRSNRCAHRVVEQQLLRAHRSSLQRRLSGRRGRRRRNSRGPLAFRGVHQARHGPCASSGVRPRPSYSERNAKARAERYNALSSESDDITMPPNHDRPLARERSSRDILARVSPIVADEVELRLRMLTQQLAECADEIRHVASVEDRANIENSGLGLGGWGWGSGAAGGWRLEAGDVTPGRMTWISHSGTWSRSINSRLENSDNVVTARADGGGPSGHQTAAQSFAGAEPFGMGGKRHVVDGDDQRNPRKSGAV